MFYQKIIYAGGKYRINFKISTSRHGTIIADNNTIFALLTLKRETDAYC